MKQQRKIEKYTVSPATLCDDRTYVIGDSWSKLPSEQEQEK